MAVRSEASRPDCSSHRSYLESSESDILSALQFLEGGLCMKAAGMLTICAVLSLGAMSMAQGNQAPPRQGLTLTSPAFSDGGIIPDKFTRKVENPVSPALEWDHVPDNTASFTLIVH